jgi:hemolysin activation/secretion protein
LCVGVSFAVNAQNLPDAATPGAVNENRPDLINSPSKDVQLSIPAKKDRPIDLESGPLISVTEIKLFSLRGADSKEQVVDPNVVSILQADLEAQKQGYTLGRLQALSDKVTNHYRQQGWILASVFVPAQEVESGIVQLHLLPGTLDSVMTEGGSSYSSEQLIRPFQGALGSTLDKEQTEASLLTVLDYPGISVSGVLEPGEDVGDTHLNLSVNSEDRFAGIVYLDNKGSLYSGEERLGAGLIFNNPLGQIDQLRIDGMIQNKPSTEDGESVDNAVFGGVSYTLRPFDPTYELGFEYSQNIYGIGRDLAAFGFEGRTKRTSFSLKKQLRRSRTFNDYLKVGLDLNDAETIRAGESESRDKLTTLALVYGADYTDGLVGGGFSALRLSLRHGLEDTFGSLENEDSQISRLGSDGLAPMDYSKFELNLSRYQRFVANTSLKFRLDMQYSEDVLVSLEQFSIGGADSVRAYPGSEYMADKGFFTSLEWITPVPFVADKVAFKGRTWGQVLQLSAFVDYAKGYKNSALASEVEKQKLSGAGIGVRFAPFENVELNMSVAKAIGDTPPSNGREPQIFLDLIYQF